MAFSLSPSPSVSISSGTTSRDSSNRSSSSTVSSAPTDRPSYKDNQTAKKEFRKKCVPRKSEGQLVNEYADFDVEGLENEFDMEGVEKRLASKSFQKSKDGLTGEILFDAGMLEDEEEFVPVDLDEKYRQLAIAKQKEQEGLSDIVDETTSFLGRQTHNRCDNPVQVAGSPGSQKSSSSQSPIPGVDYLPGVEHLTNIQVRSVFIYVDAQGSGEYSSAVANTDNTAVNEVVHFIDSWLDRTPDGDVMFDYGSADVEQRNTETFGYSDLQRLLEEHGVVLNDDVEDDAIDEIPRLGFYFDAQTQCQVDYTALNQILLSPYDQYQQIINRANENDEPENNYDGIGKIVSEYSESDVPSRMPSQEDLPTCLQIVRPRHPHAIRPRIPNSILKWQKMKYIPCLSHISEYSNFAARHELPASPYSFTTITLADSLGLNGSQAGTGTPLTNRRASFLSEMDDEVDGDAEPESVCSLGYISTFDSDSDIESLSSIDSDLIDIDVLEHRRRALASLEGTDILGDRRRALMRLEGTDVSSFDGDIESEASVDDESDSEPSIDFTGYHGGAVQHLVPRRSSFLDDEMSVAADSHALLDNLDDGMMPIVYDGVLDFLACTTPARAVTVSRVDGRAVREVHIPASAPISSAIESLFASDTWWSEPDLTFRFMGGQINMWT
ncbi:hypothetical protein P280DRAFT_80558 [Massarina eburnea CBS 473.64]|uniref:Uncharacterized protein n=1 Tax=Massarina eburnea CBS 473.64 TaxID=1395130 RepID=A0A6A6RV69_9PLEO|nr:hypothetical protein P280DRAFT_80558 [Massarina eburnea CBS 473.64]